MLLQNKKSGSIVFKDGEKKITFLSGSVIEVGEKAAKFLTNAYKGLVVEIINKNHGGDKNVSASKRK